MTLTYRDKHGSALHTATHRDLTKGTWTFEIMNGQLVRLAYSDRLPFVMQPPPTPPSTQESGRDQAARERLFRRDPED